MLDLLDEATEAGAPLSLSDLTAKMDRPKTDRLLRRCLAELLDSGEVFRGEVTRTVVRRRSTLSAHNVQRAVPVFTTDPVAIGLEVSP